MLRYLIRRLLLTIPVLLGVATLVFSLIHFIPGDPAQAMLGEGAAPEDVAQLRERLGLDRPLLVQYGSFLDRACARRSRRVAAKRSAGAAADSRAHARDGGAGVRLDGGGRADSRCRSASSPRSGAGPAIDLRRDDPVARRHLGSEFLARSAAGDRVCGRARAGCRSAAAGRWRISCCPLSPSAPRWPPFWPA